MDLIRTIVVSNKEPTNTQVGWLDIRNNKTDLKFYKNGEWVSIYGSSDSFLSKEEADKNYIAKEDLNNIINRIQTLEKTVNEQNTLIKDLLSKIQDIESLLTIK